MTNERLQEILEADQARQSAATELNALADFCSQFNKKDEPIEFEHVLEILRGLKPEMRGRMVSAIYAQLESEKKAAQEALDKANATFEKL